ncbi:MAG: 6,7-dimethyl-8-ribityllumazine synthase [Verrucomicrobiales bacterium]|nr:6,7-dimethyl-8-ribityllumazine synthase [Verrucomicrobiales bacterium]
MLKRVRSRKTPSSSTPVRLAVVASEYNRKQVDGLLDAAVRTLKEAGVEVDVYRVPGAFEIPVVAESLAGDASRRWSAVVCLGVIIRGETGHADLVGTAVTQALMGIGVRHRIPVIHEVLLVADKAQADARCFEPKFNRGGEAAQTALAMVRLMRRLPVAAEGGDVEG